MTAQTLSSSISSPETAEEEESGIGTRPADLVIVCPHLGSGGVQRVVSTLANAWNARGWKICVLTIFKEDRVYPLADGVEYVPLYVSNKTSLYWILEHIRARIEGTAIASILRYCSPSLFFGSALPRATNRGSRLALWMLHLPLYIRTKRLEQAIRDTGTSRVLALCGSSNIMTVMACRKLPVRVTISERNDPSVQCLNAPWEALRPLWYGAADVVTANTTGALDAMRAYVPEQKLAYVPNPVVRDRSTSSRPPPGLMKSPSILTVARLHHQKAHDVLISAFAQFSRRHPEWRLAIAGSGKLEGELRDLAESLGVSDRVDWYGQVENPYELYDAAEIFALPSRCEGMPNALMEAMSCGLPSIVSDASPGPLDLIEHESTGLVVAAEDAIALSDSMTRLANDRELRGKLGSAARERVAGYDLPSTLAAWERLLGRPDSQTITSRANTDFAQNIAAISGAQDVVR